MDHYRLACCDERDNNWITLRDNLDGGPLIYCAYLKCICPECNSLNRDAVFARKGGLEGGQRIRVRTGREIAESDDGFFCVRTRVLKLFKRHRVAGFETRSIPYTDWHAVRIVSKVAFKNFKPQWGAPRCKVCNRWPYYGIADALSDISVPNHDNTFFTPEIERAQSGQDVYMSEKVALLLKSERVKSGELHRLLEDSEVALLSQGTETARRKVKSRFILL